MLDRTKEPSTANPEAKSVPVVPAVPAPVPKRRGRWRATLMLGGIAVVALGAGYVWLTGGRYVSTDDAYVRAGKLMVSTDVSGIVSDVDVKEGQQVAAGDVLFRVDPRQYEIAVRNAQANLDQTRLTLESMKVDYQRMASDVAAAAATVQNDEAIFNRYQVLVKDTAALSQASYDQARFTLESDRAKVDSLKQQASVLLAKLGGKPDLVVEQHPLYLQAQAAFDESKRQLDHATVRAPFSGTVTEVDNLQPGLYLVAATAALTNQGAVGLISSEDMWVEANIKETDLTYLKAGDTVDVSIDAYPGHRWTGVIDSIAPASGAEFSVLPAQNASGNWVKVVQRVPVRIRVPHQAEDPVLRAGMSAFVEIDTGHSRSLRDVL
ncbi:HlyD family secretion protein [Ancylobacter defluvii]|uniref:Hemolysin secretion protein D n=1 Tax=Ancylobacter defluvii TaxID=1282440 RepID=A0A9W6JRT8_9HYPH|nr:HlyD family secretion protein [Ancylobacter defluvii]MBS7587765.1 HlyD family secretion protein [Ancylobacter defluvii]GLK82575.1 hemolysin secretion protein D [Ancylobacter defluvii]